MKKTTLIFIFILNATLSIAQTKNTDMEEIKEVMLAQQEAWNKADLDAFMTGYWKSDSLKFIGKNGIKCGWQTTLDNYKKSYPNADAMGKLTFTILNIELQNSDAAFVIGKWELKRTKDDVGGYFTLLWKKIDGKWLIVVDHTS